MKQTRVSFFIVRESCSAVPCKGAVQCTVNIVNLSKGSSRCKYCINLNIVIDLLSTFYPTGGCGVKYCKYCHQAARLCIFTCDASPGKWEARMSQEVLFCDGDVEAPRISRSLVLRQKRLVAAVQFWKKVFNHKKIVVEERWKKFKVINLKTNQQIYNRHVCPIQICEHLSRRWRQRIMFNLRWCHIHCLILLFNQFYTCLR